eukprot:SAG11_NODE_837_length_6925_cov_43.745532_3_plen_61_part_00
MCCFWLATFYICPMCRRAAQDAVRRLSDGWVIVIFAAIVATAYLGGGVAWNHRKGELQGV